MPAPTATLLRLLAAASIGSLVLAGCTSARQASQDVSTSPPAPASTSQSPATSHPRTLKPSVRPSTRRPKPRPTTSRPTTPRSTTPRPATTRPSTHAPAAGSQLPLGFSTGTARQVVTVVAPSTGSTTARLQAWTKAAGGGWTRHGPELLAHLGSQGLTSHPSESLSATPIGSFTLTQAFGALSNPGSGLPYLQTTAADWWISQSGSLYNTHQHCSSGCGFTQGDPNEHLRYETPYYNYAVVIDYNRFPVRQGAGSAFFLHVTDGRPTAGCVSIPQQNLVSIMQWLAPTDHPRMLIGVG